MARTAAAWARYWVDSPDTLCITHKIRERRPSAHIEPFPHDRTLADMRARPWKYDESFVDHMLDMRNTWLVATHQTEWDCSECGTWHVTPDEEFHADIPCPGRSVHPVMTRPEPSTATPRGKRLAPMPSDNAPVVIKVVPTSADLPDLPDNATPEQIAEWRIAFTRMREARSA